MVGVGLFSLASLAGGLAPSSGFLVGARVVQGLSAAVLSAAALTILISTFSEQGERARALAAWGAAAATGGAAGTLLGGVLADLLSWRWILLINVPVGIAMATVATSKLAGGHERSSTGLDVAGALSATVGIGALVFGVVQSSTHGWVASATLVPLVAAVADPRPVRVDRGAPGAQPYVAAAAVSRALGVGRQCADGLLGATSVSMWFFISLYLQKVRSYDPLQAGLAIAPLAAVIAVASRLTPRLMTRIGAKRSILAGSVLAAAGFGWWSALGAHSTYLAGAIGLAVLATVAAGHTKALGGARQAGAALAAGYARVPDRCRDRAAHRPGRAAAPRPPSDTASPSWGTPIVNPTQPKEPSAMPVQSRHPLSVLVTGASSGFGDRLTRSLSARGHAVAASMHDIAGRNAEARDRLKALSRVSVVELGVTDEASVSAGVTAAIDATGGLDAVINNAGFGVMGLLEGVTVDQARRQFDTNVFGPLLVDRAVLPHFRQRGGGVLVHVTSSAGRRTLPFGGIYAASKYALEAVAETYRYELAALNIDSVIVEPGLFDTNLGRNGVEVADPDRLTAYGDLASKAAESISGGRTPGDPQQVADAIIDLIQTPTGQRPLRTLVGDDTQPLAALNAATDDLARHALTQIGLAGLLATTPTTDNP